MKSKEELNALKEEVETESRKLHELTDEELERVTGGAKIDEATYQIQVTSWYDNENSYTSQMVRTMKYFAESNKANK